MISFLFMIATAWSADHNYTTNMEVNLNAPPVSAGNGLSLHKGVVRVTSPANLPDTVIQSDWSPLTCELKDSYLTVVVTGNHQTWPTSLPSSGVAKCTSSFGGISYELEVSLTQGADAFWGNPFEGFSSGYVIKLRDGDEVTSMNPLPAGNTYITGQYQALLSPGVNWYDVYCRINEDAEVSGRYWLIVKVFQDAETNTGGCPVYKTGDELVGYVPIDVERL